MATDEERDAAIAALAQNLVLLRSLAIETLTILTAVVGVMNETLVETSPSLRQTLTQVTQALAEAREQS